MSKKALMCCLSHCCAAPARQFATKRDLHTHTNTHTHTQDTHTHTHTHSLCHSQALWKASKALLHRSLTTVPAAATNSLRLPPPPGPARAPGGRPAEIAETGLFRRTICVCACVCIASWGLGVCVCVCVGLCVCVSLFLLQIV